MANASVEKFKALGIRHGEKAVVGLTAALFLVCTAMAIIRPTLDMKPEQLTASANQASANLQKQQPQADILAKLERDGLVEPNLVSIVENRFKNSIKPDAYTAKLDWVTPEPGAGLIRDQPELIAPTELAAFPGRGGIYMYKLDDKFERIIDTGEEAKKKGKGAKKGGAREESPAAKKRREAEEEKRQAAFAGKADAEKEKEKEKEKANDDEADPAAQGPWKEETRGKRWVVITGVIDNEQLKKNYLLALKNPAIAYPNYKRLEAERRNRLSDGTWSAWAAPDQNKNYEVLDNLPELDTEYVPLAQRPAALVDPLPMLRAGYWTAVHVAKLVPPEILETPKAKPGGAGMSGMMMGSSMAGAGGAGMESRMGPGPGSASGGMMGSNMAGNSESRMGSGRPGMMGSGGGGGGSVDAEEANFTKIDEKTLMLRSLDFTVEADNMYQYRVRIVVVNPNYTHTDVNPGVDVDSKELLGPWSEPTDPVTLPADVAAYAQAPEPASRRDDLVSFQIVKWDIATGQTVVKLDGAGPGEFIGEYGPIPMPSSEGKGVTSSNIDFNSRSIVLDTYGGSERLPEIGLDRNQFIVPSMAMIVEPDGSVVIRDQARDKTDEVREDMESNYKQAIADSGAKREKGSGSRRPGAMGGRSQSRSRSMGSGGGRSSGGSTSRGG